VDLDMLFWHPATNSASRLTRGEALRYRTSSKCFLELAHKVDAESIPYNGPFQYVLDTGVPRNTAINIPSTGVIVPANLPNGSLETTYAVNLKRIPSISRWNGKWGVRSQSISLIEPLIRFILVVIGRAIEHSRERDRSRGHRSRRCGRALMLLRDLWPQCVFSSCVAHGY
jgi:hypothetical protein